MNGMELWFLGQSSFRLCSPEETDPVYVDPFLSAHKGRTWKPPVTPEDLAQAGTILVTHSHIDHFDRPTIKAANQVKGARFILVVPSPIEEEARALGIPQERLIGVQPGQTIEVPGARVTPVPACHGETMADAYSFGRDLSNGLVRYLGYIVEIGGVKAYHAGDTIPFKGLVEMLQQQQVQLDLLPINGRDFFRETERDLVGNMNVREAAEVAQRSGAKALIPMHWDLFPHNLGFPSWLASYMRDYTPEVSLIVMGRAQKMIYGAYPGMTQVSTREEPTQTTASL